MNENKILEDTVNSRKIIELYIFSIFRDIQRNTAPMTKRIACYEESTRKEHWKAKTNSWQIFKTIKS